MQRALWTVVAVHPVMPSSPPAAPLRVRTRPSCHAKTTSRQTDLANCGEPRSWHTPPAPPGGAASLTSHGTSAATVVRRPTNRRPSFPHVCSGLPVFRWTSRSAGSHRSRSRRSPSALFFLARPGPSSNPTTVCDEGTSGNGSSTLAPRRATAWRHNACDQPKRLDQSLFAFGGFAAFTRPASAWPSTVRGSALDMPTAWSAVIHSPKRTEYGHNRAELRESGEPPSLGSVSLHCPEGHMGVETAARDTEHVLNRRNMTFAAAAIGDFQRDHTRIHFPLPHRAHVCLTPSDGTADKAQSQIFAIFKLELPFKIPPPETPPHRTEQQSNRYTDKTTHTHSDIQPTALNLPNTRPDQSMLRHHVAKKKHAQTPIAHCSHAPHRRTFRRAKEITLRKNGS